MVIFEIATSKMHIELHDCVAHVAICVQLWDQIRDPEQILVQNRPVETKHENGMSLGADRGRLSQRTVLCTAGAY